MRTLAELLRPIDPFRLQPDWRPTWIETEYTPMHIRPVYIPGDLRILLRWRSIGSRAAEPNITQGARLIHHLREMLMSDNAQSFLVSKADQPIAQFDLQSIDQHLLYKEINTQAGDIIMHSLSNSVHDASPDWIEAVTFLLHVIFWCSDIHAIFFRSDPFSFHQVAFLEKIGFSEIPFDVTNRPKRVFRLLKSEWVY